MKRGRCGRLNGVIGRLAAARLAALVFFQPG